MARTESKAKPSRTPKRQYKAPDGWKTLQKVHAEIANVRASSRADGHVCGIFNQLWKDYTKTRTRRTQLRELCVAVNPKWLRAALASEEMQGQTSKASDGTIRIYGFRVREDAGLDVSDIVLEEKQDV